MSAAYGYDPATKNYDMDKPPIPSPVQKPIAPLPVAIKPPLAPIKEEAKSEKVMVFPAEVFNYYGNFKGLLTGHRVREVLDHVLYPSNLSFLPRNQVENNPAWKQVIPYAVLFRGREVFRYLRNSKGNESRLHNLWSLGVGGHINEGDSDYACAFSREIEEEIGLKVTMDPMETIKGLIYDPSNLVGQVHFGVVHFIQLSANPPPFTPEKTMGEWHWHHTIEIKKTMHQFENWSQFIIKDLL